MPILNNINNGLSNNDTSIQVVTHIPGHCTGLDITVSGENTADVSVKVKVSDSDDSDWGGTKIVAKEGSLPEDENDGIVLVDNIVKNKFKETASDDLPLITQSEETKTSDWYFAPFPYSTGNAVNKFRSGYIKKSISVIETPPTFANASWAKIREISDRGSASSIFNVGDTKSFMYDGQETSVYIIHIDDNVNKIICGIADLIPNPNNYPLLTVFNDCYVTNDGNPHYTYMTDTILNNIQTELGFETKDMFINRSIGSSNTNVTVKISIPANIYKYSNSTSTYISYSIMTKNPNTNDMRKKLIGDLNGDYQKYFVLNGSKGSSDYSWYNVGINDSNYKYDKTSVVGDNDELYTKGFPYCIIFAV